jgi:hypothetical protein
MKKFSTAMTALFFLQAASSLWAQEARPTYDPISKVLLVPTALPTPAASPVKKSPRHPRRPRHTVEVINGYPTTVVKQDVEIVNGQATTLNK